MSARTPALLTALAVMAALLALPPLAPPPAAAQDADVIGIPLRGPTAVSLGYSRETHPDGGVDEVLIGRADAFPDSLAAGGLSGDRPLLLTDPRFLSAGVADEISRLGATSAIVLGGELAVAPAVVGELEALGLSVSRRSGATRIETAVAIAEDLGARTAILARAHPSPGATDPTQAFADSLAAGAWAAAEGWPVLLTQTEVLTPSTAAHLTAGGYDRVLVVGGPAAVSDAVLGEVRSIVPDVTRVAGPTRFATAAAIAEARGLAPAAGGAQRVILTAGQQPAAWTAGFAASSHAAAFAAPVLLAVGPDLPAETREHLAASASAQPGGTALVCSADPAACAEAAELLGHPAGDAPAVGVAIDPSLVPAEPVRRPDGEPAPTSALASSAGGGQTFATDELVVLGDDVVIERITEAYGGEVLRSAPLPDGITIPPQPVDGVVAPMFLDGITEVRPDQVVRLRLDRLLLPAVQAADVAALVAARDPYADTTLAFSDDDGLALFAAAQQLESAGVPVLLNASLGLDQVTPHGERDAQEAATAPGISGYDRNPWTWDWLDGPVGYGVPDAWRAMAMAGVRPGGPDQLTLGVLDGGFPADPELGTAVGTDPTPNIATCGANPCPYHGFSVAVTAAGVVGNGRGTAGVSGGYADLHLANTALVGVDVATLVFDILDATAGADAINISASEVLPEVPDGVAAAIGLNLVTGAFAASGKAIFASAGNVSATPGLAPADADVDATEHVLFFEIETQRTIPCELEGVECVGGVVPDTGVRDTGSWYGSSDVDWWAPFTVYTGPTPSGTPPVFADEVVRASGTSFSSPWAAAAYLLIRRADPAIDRGAALARMRTTAIRGGTAGGGTALRVLQPYDAVLTAYGSDDPFEVDWEGPPDGASYDQGNVELSATVTDPLDAPAGEDPDRPVDADITWRVNGDVVGTTTHEVVSTADLEDGANTVSLEVRRGPYTWVAERTISKGNTPPRIQIDQPADGSSWTEGQTIPLEASSFDPNEPGFELSDAQITWSAGGVSRTGAVTSVPASTLGVGTHTVTVTGDDGQASDTDSVTITVTAAGSGNQAPDPIITAPSPGAHTVNSTTCSGASQCYVTDLRGSASDPEDGALSGASLVWTVIGDHDGDGSAETRTAGTGTSVADVRFNVHGSSTPYTIRLTATDADGASRTITRDISVTAFG